MTLKKITDQGNTGLSSIPVMNDWFKNSLAEHLISTAIRNVPNIPVYTTEVKHVQVVVSLYLFVSTNQTTNDCVCTKWNWISVKIIQPQLDLNFDCYRTKQFDCLIVWKMTHTVIRKKFSSEHHWIMFNPLKSPQIWLAWFWCLLVSVSVRIIAPQQRRDMFRLILFKINIEDHARFSKVLSAIQIKEICSH